MRARRGKELSADLNYSRPLATAVREISSVGRSLTYLSMETRLQERKGISVGNRGGRMAW